MCIGKIILYISIIFQILFFILFVLGMNSLLNPIKLISIGVPYGLFIYLWFKLWKNIIGEMCLKGLDFESVMVLIYPIVYLIFLIICYFVGLLLGKIFNYGAGEKIQNIKVTNEFKDYIDNNIFDIIEYDNYKKDILVKYAENSDERNLHNELFLDKGWTIKNLTNNPYSFEIIGNGRNNDKRGLIILENKTTKGWNGYLKIVKFNREVDSNISNYSNINIIDEEYGYEIGFRTTVDYQDIMEIKGIGNDRGIYSCKKNISPWRILINVIVIIIIIYIFYLAIFKY